MIKHQNVFQRKENRTGQAADRETLPGLKNMSKFLQKAGMALVISLMVLNTVVLPGPMAQRMICDNTKSPWADDPENLITPDGGTASSSDGSVAVTFPAGGTSQDLFICFNRPDSAPYPNTDFELVGDACHIIAISRQGDMVSSFDSNTVITLNYNPASLRGISGQDLKINYYDETLEKWTELPSAADTVNHAVTAATDHLAAFGLFARTERPAVVKTDLRNSPEKISPVIPDTEVLASTPVLTVDDHNELRFVRLRKGKNNTIYVRYNQHFKGVRIFGCQITVAVSESGRQKIRGTFAENLEFHVQDVTPVFDADTALSSMKARHKEHACISVDLSYGIEESELVIYTDSGRARLAYYVSFLADAVGVYPSRPHYIFDAKTQEILRQWDGLATGPYTYTYVPCDFSGDQKTGTEDALYVIRSIAVEKSGEHDLATVIRILQIMCGK